MSTADETDTGLLSWVDAEPAVAGGVLVRYAQALESRMETRMTNWEIYAAVYSERLETSLRPSRTRWLQAPSSARNANLTFNMARSLVETEHATTTEAQPRPTFQTEDGNQPQQDKAVEMQRAVDGLMSDLRGYQTIEQAELDKGVLGGGCHKVHAVGGRPAIDRVLLSDLLIDEDLIGSGQDPKQIIHRQETSRAAMLVYFKDAGKKVLDAIKAAPALVSSGINSSRADLIAVYDAYSAPIDVEHPGRHGIAIENFEELIFVEPWESPRLPFVFQFWQRPTKGWYPIGIIEQVLGIQVEINRFYRTISRCLKRWGIVTALIPTLAKINTQQWTNVDSGQFIPFDPAGGQPVFMNGNLLSPEVMGWLAFNIDNGYQVTGIPKNQAFAHREEGIPSARGQREISQKAASRLAPQSKGYERAFIDTAWLLDDIIRKLKKAGEQLVISTVDNGALHKVDIDVAISLEPGTYKIDVFAGNLLSRHPASKREEVQEYTKAGIFSVEEAKALVLNPDVSAAIGQPVDVRGIYKRQIKAAVKDGKFTRPEAFWPKLELGKSLYGDALFESQSTGVPEDRLQILRDWLVAAKDILDAAAPPPPPATQAAQPQGAMQ